jgi:hypothetical protein
VSAPRQRKDGHVTHTDMLQLRDWRLREADRVKAGRYVARVAVLSGWSAERIAETLDVLGLPAEMGERPDEGVESGSRSASPRGG